MKIIEFIAVFFIHKFHVFWAGVKIGGVSWWRLLIHDLSKLGPKELPFYFKKHFGYIEYHHPDFLKAKKHHIERNPHHWQHWIIDDKPVPMPESFVREMVADWMGAEKSYNGKNGSWDIRNYFYKKEYPRMKDNIHIETKRILKKVLDEQGIEFPEEIEVDNKKTV